MYAWLNLPYEQAARKGCFVGSSATWKRSPKMTMMMRRNPKHAGDEHLSPTVDSRELTLLPGVLMPSGNTGTNEDMS